MIKRRRYLTVKNKTSFLVIEVHIQYFKAWKNKKTIEKLKIFQEFYNPEISTTEIT